MRTETMAYTDDAVFFYDTLTCSKPFISASPRNHDSFAFVTDGTLAYEKQGVLAQIKKGQVAYIPKGSIDKSGAYACDSVSYIAVNFNFDEHTASLNHHLPLQTVCSSRNAYQYEKLFQKAVNEYRFHLPGSQMICSGILCQIIGMLYNDRVFDRINDKKTDKMKIALDYLNRNYGRADLTISELASITGISERHFRRLLFDLYQKKPHEFLRDLRLNQAELFIVNTSKPISDIALQCGFSDVYSFSHCFKREFGISPTDYRETQADHR